MRRVLALRGIVATLTVAATAATSCGVLADDNAATVQGTGVPTATVDAMARDKAFAQLLGYEPAPGESVLPGSTARDALGFAVQTQALVNEAERWGLTVDPDSAGLEQQLAQAPVKAADLSPAARNVAELYVGAVNALGDRFTKLAKPTDRDLRLLYGGAPSRWRQVCVLAVAVPVAKAQQLARAVEGGTALAVLPDKVRSAQVAVDPKQGCITTDVLPRELRGSVDRARVGSVEGPVVLASQGQKVAVWFRVQSRTVVSFGTARKDLEGLAARLAKQGPAAWIALVVADTTEVNPRYGSEIELSGDGQGGVRAVVAAPQSPVTTAVPSTGAATGGGADSSGAGAGADSSGAGAGAGSAGAGSAGAGPDAGPSGAGAGSAGAGPDAGSPGAGAGAGSAGAGPTAQP